MPKPWSESEDAFLLDWGPAVGADFVASHDLGRPDGAGTRRMRHLKETGAAAAFVEMRLAEIRFNRLAGRIRGAQATEIAAQEEALLLGRLTELEASHA